MAEAGADIVICDKNVEGLRETEEKIIKMGRKCLSLICDVTDEIQVSKMIQEIVNHYGHLDILINNAGIAGVAKMIHEYSTEEWYSC